VIELIKGIEVGSVIDVDGLYKEIKVHLEENIDEMDSEDAVDFSSAEFSIEYDNRLALEAIDISSDTIAEMVANDVKDYLKDFFTPNDITE
jgi:predicted Zn-dependent peptidase